MFANDEEKLTWMYKTPGTSIDKEEYLLGRPVDKAFELARNEEKTANGSLKNYMEHECIPTSIRDLKEQKVITIREVDLASKLQDDPLAIIQQKQVEFKMKLLKNPIKLKRIAEKTNLYQKKVQSKKEKKSKSKKKKSRRSSSSSSSSSSSTSLQSSYSSDSVSKSLLFLDNLLMKNFYPIKTFIVKSDLVVQESISRKRSRSPRREQASPKNFQNLRQKLSEEERNRKIQEMMENANWRETERSRAIKRYDKEDYLEKKINDQKRDQTDFKHSYISKSLLKMAENSSVESQIKSKKYNVQRSKDSMNSTFCKRT